MADDAMSAAARTAATASAATGMSGALATGAMISMAAPKIAGAPQPSGGGGFTFSPEELDAVIAEWEDLRDSLRDDIHQARFLASVQPPGNEFASSDLRTDSTPYTASMPIPNCESSSRSADTRLYTPIIPTTETPESVHSGSGSTIAM